MVFIIIEKYIISSNIEIKPIRILESIEMMVVDRWI